ncbi:hypothetical protein [Vibrio owensii]|uniref:hypothetical protein n=1 Tax=Vibrio harveyi group TaxID=717610 RepID=UPI003CC52A93
MSNSGSQITIDDIIVAHGEVCMFGEKVARNLTPEEAHLLLKTISTKEVLNKAQSECPKQQKANLYEEIRSHGILPILQDHAFLVLESVGENQYSYWLTIDGATKEFESHVYQTDKKQFLANVACTLTGVGFSFYQDYVIDLSDTFKPGGVSAKIDDKAVFEKTSKCIDLITKGQPDSIHCSNLVKKVSEVLRFAKSCQIRKRLTKDKYDLIELVQALTKLQNIERELEIDLTYRSIAEYLILKVPDELFEKANIKKHRESIAKMQSFDLSLIDKNSSEITDIKFEISPYKEPSFMIEQVEG